MIKRTNSTFTNLPAQIKKIQSKEFLKDQEAELPFDISKVWELIFQPHNDEPVLRMAGRMCRLFAWSMKNFLADLKAIGLDPAKIPELPLVAYKDGDFDNLVVYSNITIPTDKIEILHKVSAISPLTGLEPGKIKHEVLGKFFESYKAEMADERKCKAWEGVSRSWKRLKRHNEISFVKFAAQYFPQYAGVKDNILRDLGDKFREARKPMDLIWCTKPEDYCIMYGEKSPDSCMKTSKGRGWYFMIPDYGHHPTSFYHYTGFTQGVYCMHKGTIIARCICYTDPHTKAKSYGRVYTSGSKEVIDKFMSLLAQAGFKNSTDSRVPEKEHIWEVPALFKDGKPFLSYPYFDNIRAPNVAYDPEKKVFRITGGKHIAGNISNDPHGIIWGDNLASVECKHCAKKFMLAKTIYKNESMWFCSEECATERGWILATDHEGAQRLVEKSDDIIQSPKDNIRFTTMGAARKNGFLPHRDIPTLEDEDGIYVARPQQRFTIHDQEFSCGLARDLIQELIREHKDVPIVLNTVGQLKIDLDKIDPRPESIEEFVDLLKPIVSEEKKVPEQPVVSAWEIPAGTLADWFTVDLK